MSTFLTVLLVIGAIGAILFLLAVNWVSKKALKVKAYLMYGSLVLVVEAMKEHVAKPEHADDQELAAHLKRAETAQVSAKAALDKGDTKGAVSIMEPVLAELSQYKRALDQKRAEQAAQAAAQKPADVIDVEAHVVEPVLQLPAPTASPADSQANTPAASAAAPADTTAGAGSGDKPEESKPTDSTK